MALSNEEHRSDKDYNDRKRQNDDAEPGPKAAHKTRREDETDDDFDDEFNFDIEER